MPSDPEALFSEQHRRGLFTSGQLVVRTRGEIRLDVSLGCTHGAGFGESTGATVTSGTPFQVLSASKPVVAFAIAVLEDQGLLDVEERVSHYVPEFGRRGKADITLSDVLTHRSGVIVPSLWTSPHLWGDWDRTQGEIWRTPPRFRRGTLAYHPYEFGWILAEVVHRITGQDIGAFLRTILPEGMKSLRFRIDPDQASEVAHTCWLGPKLLRFCGVNLARGFEEAFNAPSTLTSLVPGASMVTNALSLAEFYEMILEGGTLADGTRLIRRDTLERYVSRNVWGIDRVSGSYMVLGRGFLLGWIGPHPYGWWNTGMCLGHPGGGFCTLAFCDRKARMAAAIVTNGNRWLMNAIRRYAPLCASIRRALREGRKPTAPETPSFPSSS
jgi:CubicO group peptidase (beta-lactamase class C family)